MTDLNLKDLEAIRASVKPKDGWGADDWELRLCEEAIAFARRATPAPQAAPSAEKLRQAYLNGLLIAAQVCDAKLKERAGTGHAREASTARALAEEIRGFAADAPVPLTQAADQSTAASKDVMRERMRVALAESLGNAMDCMRVWSAWRVGTMRREDFSVITNDAGRLEEIVDAAMSVVAATPAAPLAQECASTDLSKMLREHDDPRLYHEADVLMAKAADEIERYYGGMMAWKKTAEARDAAPLPAQQASESDIIGYITIGDVFYGPDGAEIEGWDIDWNNKLIDAMPEFAVPEATYGVRLVKLDDAAMGDARKGGS